MLFQNLPKKIQGKTKSYRIRTDFNYWITFDLIINDKKIDDVVKQIVIIDTLVIDSVLPSDIESVITALFSFYFLNEERKQNKSNKKQEKTFCFKQDWKYIYSSFYQQYNIDLFTKKLHWFKFKSLFDGLDNKTQFMKIINYRVCDLSEIKDKDIRKKYAELKKEYALTQDKEQRRKASDIEAEILRKLGGG